MSRWTVSRPTYYVQTGGMHENPFGVPKDEIVRYILDNPAEVVAQVVFGKYVESSGLVFTSEIVQNLFDRSRQPVASNFWIDRDTQQQAAGILRRVFDYSSPFHTGVDFARQTDYTVLFTLDTRVVPARVVYFKRLNRVPWETIYREVGMAVKLWGPNVLVDASGPAGDVVVDALESRNFCTTHDRTVLAGQRCRDKDGGELGCDPEDYLPLNCIEGYQFGGGTGQRKKELVEHLRNCLAVGYDQNDPSKPFGWIKSPPIVQLEEELSFYSWDDKRLQTDALFALALAAWSGLEEPLDAPDFGSVYGRSF